MAEHLILKAVESLGLTADGKLREPRFKGVRFDKHEPDA